MGEFFKPWRRKTCLCVLVTTCVLTAGWIRSPFIAEGITTPFLNIASSDNSLILLFHKEPLPLHLSCYGSEYRSAIGDETFDSHAHKRFDDFRWTFRGMGFGDGDSRQVRIFLVPYWSVVIPLTLLSAYLLLSKPRVPAPKKISDPTLAEGT